MLGAAVKAIRDEKGITQDAMAESTGFTRARLSDIEQERANPRWTDLHLLAWGLGVGLRELVVRAEAMAGEGYPGAPRRTSGPRSIAWRHSATRTSSLGGKPRRAGRRHRKRSAGPGR
jgi:transcriptional regulator with XRE-family HTH domain